MKTDFTLEHPTDKANFHSASSRSPDASYKFILQNKGRAFLLVICLEACVFGLDLITDPFLIVAPFYFIPIALSVWSLPVSLTFCFALLSSIGGIYSFDRGMTDNSIWITGFNFLISLSVYAGFTLLLYRLKSLIGQLSNQTAHILDLNKQLEHRAELQSSIRRALPRDADEITELAIANGFVGGVTSGGVTVNLSKQTILNDIRNAIKTGQIIRPLWTGGAASVPAEYWVSMKEGVVAGYIFVMGLDNKSMDDCELHVIAVAKCYRGLGIGSALLDFFCTHYRGRRTVAACKEGSVMRAMLKRRDFKYFDNTIEGYILTEHR